MEAWTGKSSAGGLVDFPFHIGPRFHLTLENNVWSVLMIWSFLRVPLRYGKKHSPNFRRLAGYDFRRTGIQTTAEGTRGNKLISRRVPGDRYFRNTSSKKPPLLGLRWNMTFCRSLPTRIWSPSVPAWNVHGCILCYYIILRVQTLISFIVLKAYAWDRWTPSTRHCVCFLGCNICCIMKHWWWH